MKAARGVWASLVGVLVATALIVAPVAAPPAHASESGTIYALMNDGRAGTGLGPLARNSALDQVALTWANQMAANGEMSHNPNYSSQIPGGWTKAAENVAHGYPSGAAMYSGWWNSAGHKANMLGDFTDVGIAFVQANGTTWGVQVFAKYGGSVPAPAPAPPPPPPAAPAPAASSPEAPAPTAAPEPVEQPAPDDSAAEANDDATEGGTWVPGGDDDAAGAVRFAEDTAVRDRAPADAASSAADSAASIQLAADGRSLAADAVGLPLTTVAVSIGAALIAIVAATALAIPRRGAFVRPVKRRFRLRNGNDAA